jgi:hypothetical protein
LHKKRKFHQRQLVDRSDPPTMTRPLWKSRAARRRQPVESGLITHWIATFRRAARV